MSLLDRPARWAASRPLAAAVALSAAITVPTAFGLERRTDTNKEKIEDIPTSTSSSTSTSSTSTSSTTSTTLAIPDEMILRVLTEFCQQHDCRPIFVDEREVQEAEVQEAEVQEPEQQDSEVQEPPVSGPPGPPGPACPTGYTLRQVRIPSVSNQTIFLVCARG